MLQCCEFSESVFIHRCFCTNPRIKHMAHTLFCHCWNPKQQERPPLWSYLLKAHYSPHNTQKPTTTTSNQILSCAQAKDAAQPQITHSHQQEVWDFWEKWNCLNSTFYSNASQSSYATWTKPQQVTQSSAESLRSLDTQSVCVSGATIKWFMSTSYKVPAPLSPPLTTASEQASSKRHN